MQEYYERRTIHDINDNVYDIWEIYRLDKLNMPRQICVFDNEESFKRYCEIYDVKERKIRGE